VRFDTKIQLALSTLQLPHTSFIQYPPLAAKHNNSSVFNSSTASLRFHCPATPVQHSVSGSERKFVPWREQGRRWSHKGVHQVHGLDKFSRPCFDSNPPPPVSIFLSFFFFLMFSILSETFMQNHEENIEYRGGIDVYRVRCADALVFCIVDKLPPSS
jgi:hypothetical protein